MEGFIYFDYQSKLVLFILTSIWLASRRRNFSGMIAVNEPKDSLKLARRSLTGFPRTRSNEKETVIRGITGSRRSACRSFQRNQYRYYFASPKS